MQFTGAKNSVSSLMITVCYHSACLVISSGAFYPRLTLMIDSYNAYVRHNNVFKTLLCHILKCHLTKVYIKNLLFIVNVEAHIIDFDNAVYILTDILSFRKLVSHTEIINMQHMTRQRHLFRYVIWVILHVVKIQSCR